MDFLKSTNIQKGEHIRSILSYSGWCVCVCVEALRVQIDMRPLQQWGDTVMEGWICMWIVCVRLSPALSGSASQLYIHGVDSSRLNVSLDITHKPPERERY